MADGYLGKCKDCTKQDSENRRKIKELDPVWSELEAERHREKSRRVDISVWRKANPEKYHAHTVLNNAVRDGKVIKKPCEICGKIKVHAHHENYNLPLEVVWLCVKHHSEIHLSKK